MRLEAFRVLHLPKKLAKNLAQGQATDLAKNSAENPVANPRSSSVFFLETCQRYIWVFNGETAVETPYELAHFCENAELFHGKEAYLFLLRVATGLESEVVGETDIFGQLKEAWKKLELNRNHLTTELGPWIQKIFEDTKEVRSRYLQNTGGASYGSLVRRLIKNQTTQPVLLVGAGKIAQSVAPFLLDSELWLWNRNASHLCAFQQELACRSGSEWPIKKLSSFSEERDGWKNAAHIVVCIPFDSTLDQARTEWFLEGGTQNRSIVHLGGLKDQSGIWNTLPGFFCLDHLFALQQSLGQFRSVQVTQALRACEERALLRSLGASLSIPHGWEDLACFA